MDDESNTKQGVMAADQDFSRSNEERVHLYGSSIYGEQCGDDERSKLMEQLENRQREEERSTNLL